MTGEHLGELSGGRRLQDQHVGQRGMLAARDGDNRLIHDAIPTVRLPPPSAIPRRP